MGLSTLRRYHPKVEPPPEPSEFAEEVAAEVAQVQEAEVQTVQPKNKYTFKKKSTEPFVTE